MTKEEILSEEATEACITPTGKILVYSAMKRYADQESAIYKEQVKNFAEHVGILREQLDQLKKENEWINVENRLPNINEKFGESDYLLGMENNNNQVVVWYSKGFGWRVAHYKADSLLINITHWRPLPQPPNQPELPASEE